ncbi:MAG: HEAT repeat domain-containing protein [Mastigocoleus sp. MO_167.B18]|nr:HEAT repeat domain-containing protein [Mastigocoleus sp. MO_167.B18]
MRLCHYLILITTCLTCLEYKPSSASIAPFKSAPESVKISQANSDKISNGVLPLRPGSRGAQVKILQTQLQELGYYEGSIDGKYGGTTKSAVFKFQSARDLSADGVFGTSTKHALEKALQEKRLQSSIDSSAQSSHITAEEQGIFGWSLIGIGVLGSTGAILYIIKLFSRRDEEEVSYFYPSHSKNLTTPNTNGIQPNGIQPNIIQPNVIQPNGIQQNIIQPNGIQQNIIQQNGIQLPLYELNTIPETVKEIVPPVKAYSPADETLINGQEATEVPSKTWLSSEQGPHLAKFNLVDKLIKDLYSPDPQQRRKAVWDLGQEGDSRAIQPLTELMVDADSQERSLILGSLSEIGSRTLKPMNQALAISLQDESPQVRQNAIRDITRVYDMMAQISQILSHALEDENSQVRETARYALSQMNRIRSLNYLEELPQELEATEINQIEYPTSE